MQRETILHTPSAHLQEMSTRYDFSRLGIFGSVARDQAAETSDIGVVVEMPPDLSLWSAETIAERFVLIPPPNDPERSRLSHHQPKRSSRHGSPCM